MQDCHRPINKYCSLIIVACSLPVVLWGVCAIFPTFDDFTTLQSPQFTAPWSKELLPNDSFWRPWDYLFGCLLGWNTVLFPTLNHIIIILGHTANALLVFFICKKLKFNHIATNIATLFFFFSPASLGATLACDGLNQTYAHFWGLAALWFFLDKKGKTRILLWPICTMIAALSKENGLAWAVVPPLIAYAFEMIDRKKLWQYEALGLCTAIFYAALRLSLNVSGMVNDEYTDATLLAHVKDLVQLLAYNWLPIDYMSIVYAPERNWLLAGITLAASLPFLLLLTVKNKSSLITKKILILTGCFFILASPHLLTLVSIMHNYAPLSITAFIVACLVDNLKTNKWLLPCFSLFLLAAIMTDVHHTLGAIKSGELGKKLALEAITKTAKPVEHAYCISIDQEDTPKYSSFAVRPTDAFAWGLSVRHYTNYVWPEDIRDTLLTKEENINLDHLVDSLLHTKVQCVWIIDGEQITVRKNIKNR